MQPAGPSAGSNLAYARTLSKVRSFRAGGVCPIPDLLGKRDLPYGLRKKLLLCLADVKYDEEMGGRKKKQGTAKKRETGRKHVGRRRLAGLAAMLLAEVMLVTVLVEFEQGPMVIAANPLIFSGGAVGLAAYLLIAWPRFSAWSESDSPRSRTRRRALFAVHFVLYLVFVGVSLALLEVGPGGVLTWAGTAIWMLLAAAVGVTAVLLGFRLRTLIWLVERTRVPLVVASMVGVSMALLTPAARSFWPHVHHAATGATGSLLRRVPGQAVYFLNRESFPVVGTPKISLVVTPACSEMDALLAFLLLGLTLLVARWRQMQPWVFAALLPAGLGILYVANAVRLYLLVLIGMPFDSAGEICVRLAHSRISGIVFLMLSLAILLGSYKVAALAAQHPWLQRIGTSWRGSAGARRADSPAEASTPSTPESSKAVAV